MKTTAKRPKPPVPVATDIALHTVTKDGRDVPLSYWDVWYVLLAENEFDGELDNLGCELREMRKLSCNSEEAEQKLSHLRDLQRRLAEAGFTLADVLCAIPPALVKAEARRAHGRILKHNQRSYELSEPMRVLPEEMSKKLTYTNRKGFCYYFRKVSGKRGTQIRCSQTESPADLMAIPETHEIVENPNGLVSCRKKMGSDIFPEEITLAKTLCAKLVKNEVRVAVETKKRMLVIHSASTTDISGFAKLALLLAPDKEMGQAIIERNIRFEPVFRLKLVDKENRKFAAFRMSWIGESDWMFLKDGQLDKLLKELVPHIEQESFSELF